MMTLKHNDKAFPTAFKLDRDVIAVSDRNVPNSRDTAEFSRFKAQLKRAVDSVDVPQYLINSIKTAIRS